MTKMLTVKETAQITNMSEYAIRKGIRAGLYPAIRICGNPTGKILINIEEFLSTINALASRNLVDTDIDKPIIVRRVAE